jgi:hypothetical protein
MAQSLAVYRQVELDRLAGRGEFGPDWERFNAALRSEPRYRRFMRRYRLPVAAAAVGGMIFFTGAGIWYADTGTAPDSPARIVELQPDQQQKMQQVVRQSLSGGGSAGSGGGLSIATGRPAPRLAPNEPIATDEDAAEPNRLYASGEGSLAGQPVFRRNHPFLDSGDVAAAVEDAAPRATQFPTFPVISRPRAAESVTFPVFSPSGR